MTFLLKLLKDLLFKNMGLSQPSPEIRFNAIADELATVPGHTLEFFLSSIPKALNSRMSVPSGHFKSIVSQLLISYTVHMFLLWPILPRVNVPITFSIPVAVPASVPDANEMRYGRESKDAIVRISIRIFIILK